MNAEKKEPLFRISKRGIMPWWASLGIRLLGLLLALVLCALIIFGITKLNPLKVYGTMYEGALGTKRRTWVTLRDAMMMLCIGLGLAPAFKMRFWNIGAEGQVLLGGIAAAACVSWAVLIPLLWQRRMFAYTAAMTAGVFTATPFLLGFLLNWRPLITRSPSRMIRMSSLASVLYLLIVPPLLTRHDIGLIWGPRHFMPILPLMAMPVAAPRWPRIRPLRPRRHVP